MANSNGSIIIDVLLDAAQAISGTGNIKKAFAGLGRAVAGAAVVGVGAITSIVEATAELNGDLARLKANANAAGFGIESIEESFKKVAAVTGEMDSAVETVSNLMATNFNENQLSEALDYINGAAIKFSDTLKTEGIADGLQETFATGEAIGMFGELLERSGVDLDVFNAGLAQATKNGTETDYVLQQLSSLGLASVYDEYKKTNPELFAYNQASTNLQTALAGLGLVFMPLVTSSKEFLASVVELITGKLTLNDVINNLITNLSNLLANLTGVDASEFVAVFEDIRTSVTNALDTVMEYTSVALDKLKALWAENGETIVQNAFTAFETTKNVIKSVLDTVVPFVQEQLAKVVSFWNQNGEQILQAAKNAFEGIKAVIDFVMPAISFVVDYVWNAIKNVVTGALDLIMGAVKLFSSVLTGDFSGMWEGIKQVFGGAIDLILGVMSLTFIGGIRTALVNLSKTAINLIKSKWTSIVNLFKTQSANALSTVTNMVKGVLNFFRNLATNAGSTVRGMATTVVNHVKTMGTNMLNAIKGVPARFREIGKNIIEGLTNGIKEMAGKAIAAVTNVVDSVVNTATSMLGIHSPSRVFKEIGLWTGDGLEVGLNSSSKNVNKAMSSMLDGILDVSESYQKEYEKLLADNEKANAQKVKDANDKIAKIESAAAKKKRKLMQDEVNQIAKLKRDAKSFELKAEEDSNKKYLSMVDQSEKAYLDVVKSYVEDKKSLDQLSLVEEAAVWEQAIEMFVVGSDQRIAVQKEYQKAVESINKEILSINESYQKQMQDIDAAYVTEAEKINKEYEDAFNARMSVFMNVAGTFDELKIELDRTGKELTKNLQGQVDAFKLWQDEFESLSKRDVDANLLEELSNLGVKALPELTALNKMTDEELTKYSELYREKASLARQQTSEELAGLLHENEGKLMDLRAQSDKQLTALQAEWDAKIKGLVTNTSSSLTSLKQVGVDAGQGLLDGLSAMQSPLMNKAKQIAEGIKETIQKALDINSPSRWMRDFVAGNMAKGFEVGVDKNEGTLKRAAGDLTDAIKVPIVNPLRGASLGIDLKTTTPINNYSSVNNYNSGSDGDAEIFIAPAPIYLEGKKIADVTYERVSQNEYRKVAISAYTQGVNLP